VNLNIKKNLSETERKGETQSLIQNSTGVILLAIPLLHWYQIGFWTQVEQLFEEESPIGQLLRGWEKIVQ
jgi:hypothetical protein